MVAAVSRLSRDKGLRAEREIVAAHADLGIKGERVPLSGAARYRGNGADVDLYVFGPDAAPLVCELKSASFGTGFRDSRALARRCPRLLLDLPLLAI